ncbi:MAG TPA: hypothetical protein P5277_02665 [Candidatus Paceibacterota bacterium]|nr:hypothetical protein [Candidatus Paceibacterota bacterium]
MKNKGAIELSMTTIIVVVLSLTLLIMGFVLVRSIMCGAIELTGNINAKIAKQVNDFFETSTAEIYCIGQGDPVKVAPGINNVWCGFNTRTGGEYTVKITEVKSISTTIPKTIKLESWISVKQDKVNIAPQDKESKKIVTLEIPEDAPEGTIRLTLSVQKKGDVSPEDIMIDWEISRRGVVQSVLC